MFELFTWIITAISIIGVILNAQKKIGGFYFWMVTNLAWVAIDLYTGIFAQAALFTFYFVMCFYGVYAWKKSDANNPTLDLDAQERRSA